MKALERVAAFALTILLVPTLSVVVSGSLEPRSFTAVEVVAEESSLVQPLEFQQDLVVCNAYMETTHLQTPMHVKQNGQHIHGHIMGIPYKQCKQISGQVRSKDKIDVDFGSIQGSFEIGDPPPNDAFLVLVVERRDAQSPLLAFQSYAFPVTPDGDVAHLAVIDTLKETSHFPSLRMEDHVTDQPGQKKLLSKRIQQLKFNNVYSIEEGSYDASILDHDHIEGSEERGQQVSKGAKRLLNLSKNKNYIVLRIGELGGQSLAVYPDLNSRSNMKRCTIALVSIFVSFLLLEHAIEAYPILATLM